MAKFSVGELAYLQNSEYIPEYNREEVEVIKGMGTYPGDTPKGVFYIQGYVVVCIKDGKRIVCREDQLRKKEPPKDRKDMDTPVSWEDCAWSPKVMENQ